MGAHPEPALNSENSPEGSCVFLKAFLLLCSFQLEMSWCGAWVWGCAGQEGVVHNEGLQKWLAVNKN